MKKSFQKSLIGVALIAAGIAAHAGTPGTTNLLFPYVTTTAGAFTFISIVQQGGNQTVSRGPSPLHFTYATKAIGAPNFNTSAAPTQANCTHLDGDAASTPNDLMQFEMSNRVDVPAAFGDTTSVPKYFPNTAVGSNRQGFLIVNNEPGSSYGSDAVYQGARLYGEAHIINTATGLAVGYSTDDLHTANTVGTAVDFSTANGPDAGLPNKVINWFAEPTVLTSFYILPLASENQMAFLGGASAAYQVSDATTGLSGSYNNNEQFQSSTATAAIQCLGIVSRATLLGDLNADFSARGGWGNFNRASGSASNSLVYKLETTSALGASTSFITRAPVR